MDSWPVYCIGLLGTAVGGFYAAYKAGSLEMKHGALVGFGSIIFGLCCPIRHRTSCPLPEWYSVPGSGDIPAGALGGFLAEALKGCGRADRQAAKAGRD